MSPAKAISLGSLLFVVLYFLAFSNAFPDKATSITPTAVISGLGPFRNLTGLCNSNFKETSDNDPTWWVFYGGYQSDSDQEVFSHISVPIRCNNSNYALSCPFVKTAFLDHLSTSLGIDSAWIEIGARAKVRKCAEVNRSRLINNINRQNAENKFPALETISFRQLSERITRLRRQ